MYVRTDSGLVLAERSADEAAISRALAEIDPELVLVRQIDPVFNRWSWRVNCVSPRGQYDLVCVWEDENREPLPLSSALVEKVKMLRRDSRAAYVDSEARNEIRRQEIAKQEERDLEASISDLEPRARSGRLPILPRRSVGARIRAERLARERRESS